MSMIKRSFVVVVVVIVVFSFLAELSTTFSG